MKPYAVQIAAAIKQSDNQPGLLSTLYPKGSHLSHHGGLLTHFQIRNAMNPTPVEISARIMGKQVLNCPDAYPLQCPGPDISNPFQRTHRVVKRCASPF